MIDSEKLDLIFSKLEKLDGIEKELQEVKNEVKEVKNELKGVKNEVKGVKNEVKGVKNKVASLELHIENVTDRNIQTVAEGHLDISRKLDEALKAENEKEMLIIKMRLLEDELRKVQERLDEIA